MKMALSILNWVFQWQSLIKTMHHRLAHSPLWWEQFDSCLWQVSLKLAVTTSYKIMRSRAFDPTGFSSHCHCVSTDRKESMATGWTLQNVYSKLIFSSLKFFLSTIVNLWNIYEAKTGRDEIILLILSI